MTEAIRRAGGEVFGITSEPQTLAEEAAEDWGLSFPCVGDPHHEIRDACQERGLLNVFSNQNYGHLRNRDWASHPKGYYQPGVLALGRDDRVLYRWRCRPTYQNMSGAGQRPTPEYVWKEIESRLGSTESAALDENPDMAMPDWSWPRFVAFLLAHGWFVRPKAFPLEREGDPPSARFQHMKWRWAGFIAAWCAAFALLPASWALLGLVLWALIALPGVIELHRQFQHEPQGEPEPV